MCGIAGWYARQGRTVDAATVRAMCKTIVHRGPDDEGVLAEGDFGFGMRRLSIVDLAGGHQPMESADRRYVITFNGEIYNHPQLRRELGVELGLRDLFTHPTLEGFAAAATHVRPMLPVLGGICGSCSTTCKTG